MEVQKTGFFVTRTNISLLHTYLGESFDFFQIVSCKYGDTLFKFGRSILHVYYNVIFNFWRTCFVNNYVIN